MTILPAAYLGSVEYFAHLLCDDCVIDLGEHFVKRSERNRAQILASGGVMDLTVHVRHANRPRTPMRDVRLDYSKRWQHQHWISLVSAYRGSPYFDHYRSSFEPFYRREYAFHAESYFQVFSDRLPFAPNLSVADLLFAEGPDAAELLRRSFR